MGTVHFKTFGCKLNQAETAGLLKVFEENGFRVVPASQPSDVFVLNTCTVTGRSDAKCRQAIRQRLKKYPKTTVIVAGCFPQVAVGQISRIPGVDYIFGTREKFDIFRHFKKPGKLKQPKIVVQTLFVKDKAIVHGGKFIGQTRAFLKIQDGCSRFCSYCIVPFARGPGRSVPKNEILDEAGRLVKQGFKELVLTGVHIGEFGKESDGKSKLPDLLKQLTAISELGRIRLSSLNSEDVTDGLIDCIRKTDKICHHFHVPLQSGSDFILEKMNRKYNANSYRSRIEKLLSAFPNAGLGTDIIVGFPGETDACFEETFRFVDSLPFTYFHVFPYSKRKGTEAAEMKNQVHPRIKSERAETLRKLGVRKKVHFLKNWIGKTGDVLFESRSRNGKMGGFSSEYVRTEIPFRSMYSNQIFKVRFTNVNGQVLNGDVLE